MTVAGRLDDSGGRTVLTLSGMTRERSILCRAPAEADLRALAGHEVVLAGRWLFEGEGVLLVESIAPGTGFPAPPR